MRKIAGGPAPQGQLATAILAAIPGTLLILNPMGRILFMSTTSADVLGHEPEHWIGQSALDLIHPDDLAIVARRIGHAVEGTSKPHQLSPIRIGLDNDWFMVEAAGFSPINFEGASGVLVSIRDATGGAAVRQARRFASETLRSIPPIDNRRRLIDELLPALIAAGGPECQLLLMSVTLTNYEAVADRVGPDHASSEVLKIGRAIKESGRGDDLVLRVTPKNLVVARVGVPTPSAAQSIAKRTHETCLAMMSSHVAFDTRVGWVLASHGDDFDEVVVFITIAEHFQATAL